MKKITLTIDGMMCGMCESHVNDAVRRAAKVKKVTSSHEKGQTEIICEDIDLEAVKAAISEIGYRVTDVREEPYEKKGIFPFFKK